MAMINIGLGDKDAAVASLGKAIDERSAKLIWLNADPIYDDLHSDPVSRSSSTGLAFTLGGPAVQHTEELLAIPGPVMQTG